MHIKKTSFYGKDYCIKLPQDIDIYIYRFEETSEKRHLEEAMVLLDSALIYCENKMQMIDKKFGLYILSKEYQAGINFIESQDLNKFSLSPFFIRNYYLKTLSSIIFNNEQDTISRNRINEEICSEIESYFNFRYSDYFKEDLDLRSNIRANIPMLLRRDLESISLYYFVRARYENINNLVEELQTFEISNEFDKKMRDEIIFTLKKVSKKDTYHIEYDI